MSQPVSWSTIRTQTRRAVIALALLFALDVAFAQQQGPKAGTNVNVISGTGADGDWTLQRQDEPSMGCSSRNPLNCMAGANDYRTVDIPFPVSGEEITGDAWLGWYTTKDGGLTWRSRLLPGFPQDTSDIGRTSPLRGYGAGADPIIRPGTNGLFYYGGLVFQREEGGGSAIFVARFIDNNNQEGSAGEPIAYLGASIVQRFGPVPNPVVARRNANGRPNAQVARREEREREEGKREEREKRGGRARAGVAFQNEQMVDKPWMAVDIPRAGAQTCTVGGPGTDVPLQTFPGGRIYIAYALFDSPDEQRGRVMFSSSADCGKTFSPPRPLSRVQSADVNDDGVANSADVARAQSLVNKTCGQSGFDPRVDINNDCKIDIFDLSYIGRFINQPVPKQPRLSQGATLAIDPQTGALQVAWRQFNDGVLPDAIVTVRSTNGGQSFSPPKVVATFSPFEQGTTDTSFRTNAFPTMAMDGTGRAYLAWSARGYAAQRPSPTTGDGRIVISSSTDGNTWSTPVPASNQNEPGHQIMPALAFAQGKLQLGFYDLREDVSQLFGPFVDEAPILTGPVPRIRHTIDAWGAQADPGPSPVFTAFRLSQYRTGNAPNGQGIKQLEFSPPNLPIFRSGTSPFMGDYLDVAPEIPFVRNGSAWTFNTAPSSSVVFHGIWTDNRDVRPPANGVWTAYTPPNPPFPRPTTSAYDPTQAVPACVPGQAGMRNQNIYTTRITQGLIVGALGNTRRLGTIQRSFPVYAQNSGTTVRSYRLTIANQPVGGQASFKQFEPLTVLDVQVPARSTVARTVFARSSDPHAQINVTVVEIAAPNGAPVVNGQRGTIILNPDPTNPELENPELENPELENPELENAEVHNPDLNNATVRNPELENPELENPELENPELENATVLNPGVINSDLKNPELENPELENPELENPELENPDLVNGSLSDTTWTLTNKGNTAGAYTVKLALHGRFPVDFKSQLIAHRIYQTPVALGCSLLKQTQTVLLANIPSPKFVIANPELENPELENPELENPELENLTIALAPGETARITLRVFDPDKRDAITFRAADNITPVAVAQAVNTPEADRGIQQPPVAAPLAPDTPVSGGTVGGTYTTTLTSPIPGTWTVSGGTVPPGVQVNSNGVITGTPTTPGTYTFTTQFTSTSGIVDYRTVTVTVGGVGAAADLSLVASAPSDGVSLGSDVVFGLNVANAGPASATNVVVTDTLPEGVTFVSVSSTLGSCQQANGLVVCNVGTLTSGAFANISITVKPTVSGAQINRATVASTEADPVSTNNSATATATTVTVAACTSVCFSGPTSFPAGPADTAFMIEKADFNEDGVPDLVFTQASDSAISVLLGNGSGGFAAPILLPMPIIPFAVTTADVNRDGHVDIIAANTSGTQAWLYLGNGQGGFGTATPINVGMATITVAAGDFNRDGNVDLVFGAFGTANSVLLLLGNGNGTFQAPTPFVSGVGPIHVNVEDFNKDGVPDIVAANNGGSTVTVFLGNGAGGLTLVSSIATSANPRARKVGDLNGDGFVDLIVVDSPTAGVRRAQLYLGLGNGAFQAPTTLALDLTVGFITSADIDGDGDLDLVLTNSLGGVAVAVNDGTGAFGTPIYFPAVSGAHVIVTDVNGDQRPDLVVAAGDNVPSQVLVLLNVCDKPPADLALTMTDVPDPVLEGDAITYSMQVTNNGPNAATGVQVTHGFGGTGLFVSASASTGTCSTARNMTTCQVGTLASGASATVTIVVRALAGGTLSSLAGVTGTTSDPQPANNTVLAQTTVTAGGSTLVVTNTNESGAGSFRQALIEANADAGPRDTIVFNIPGAGVHTIRPTRLPDLPVITQPVVIDGTTQPGYAGTPLIEISGENDDFTSGLIVNAGGSVIRGLAINRFGDSGILLQSPNNILEANFIGTNAAGTAALPNGGDGVTVRGANNTIGGTAPGAGNVISGNLNDGIDLGASSASNTVIRGNRVGTNAAGTAAIGNGFQGIWIAAGAFGNVVGGTTADASNLLSGNGSTGVMISGPTTLGNTVLGNLIGTNAAGTSAIPNVFDGVNLRDGTSGNLIGSTTSPGGRNVVSGNRYGVFIESNATGNLLAGNFIGTDITGAAPIPNSAAGIYVDSSGNTIGGALGNTIAFNAAQGVVVVSGTGTSIVGNSIFSNGSLGIDLLPAGVTPNDAGDADSGPNNLINFPVLTSATTSAGVVRVVGTLSPTPSTPFRVQFFASPSCDASGNGEGATPLATMTGSTPNTGDTAIDTTFGSSAAVGSAITAILTDAGNNSSEFSNCVTLTTESAGPSADLVLTKTDSQDPAILNTPFTYTLRVHNQGPDTATNIVVTDTLPASLIAPSVGSTGGSCTINASQVRCTFTQILSEQDALVTITVTPTAAGPITNQATVTATETDPVPGNNTATETTMISAMAPCNAASFTGPTHWGNELGPTAVLKLVDINHDGFKDAIASTQTNPTQGNPGGITVMLNDGSGQFAAPVFTSITQSAFGMAVADFNGDTHPDVIVGANGNTQNPGLLRLLLGDGAGHLTLTPQSLPIANGSLVEAFDQDGDGDQDVITRNTANDLILLRNDGAGNFAAPVTLMTGANGTYLVGDINHDSRPDIVVAMPVSGFSVLLANATGGYNAPITIPTAGPGIRVRALGDFNEDGNVDLVIAEGSAVDGSAHITMFLGNGAGGFGSQTETGAGTRVNFPVAADINGDGHLDLVSNNTPLNSVSVQLGTGTGTFGAPTHFPVPVLSNPAVADLNGDDRLDIMAGDNFGDFHVLLNACGLPPSDLGVTVAESADPVNEGDEVTYTVTVTNNLPTEAVNVRQTITVTIGGTVSPDLDLIDATSSRGGELNLGESFGFWTLPSVPGNSTTTFVYRLRANAGGVLSFAVGVSSDNNDTNPSNNTVFETTTVNATSRTLVVTTTDDFGPGSLRHAIEHSNADAGDVDRITFNIPGSGVHTITPTGLLPAITQPVIIDGTTQPGFTGTPLIELNGSLVGNGNGLALQSGSSASTIRGLAINRFGGGAGIFVGVGSSGNLIAGNFVGTDPTGTIARPNNFGIMVMTANNTIGGTTAADRNLFSGNTLTGINLSGGGANNNTVSGNYVGTTITGLAALPNQGVQSGIFVNVGSNNTIGGTGAGAGNVVSGNTQHAVTIFGAGAAGNVIQGNLIGVDATGLVRLANNGIAVDIVSAVNTTVGGDTAAARNVLSGNVTGIQIRTNATGNSVRGNYIGVGSDGTTRIANTFLGITINDSATGNTVGGTTAASGNVISGNNGNGISFSLNASGNRVQNNLIGINAAGTLGVGNTGVGVSVDGPNNGIGPGNTIVLSGLPTATRAGIDIGVNGVTTTVVGNFVGTNSAGTVTGNTGGGIVIRSSGNVVGNTTGGRNVISGNSQAGVSISAPTGSVVANNQIVGNYIGLNAAGTGATANATGITVGVVGTGSLGANLIDRNVISGNTPGGGINAGTGGSLTITGNLIGTNAAGTAGIANTIGISLNNGTYVIGGTTPQERNVISGNTGGVGIGLSLATAGSTILGNYIGTNAAGTAAIPNAAGISVNATSTGVTIGGTLPGSPNVISGNTTDGIVLQTGSTGATIWGNLIGTDAAGLAAIANGQVGIRVNTAGAAIGGVATQMRNIISGNTLSGIQLMTTSNNTQIIGNYIGTTIAGNAALPNGAAGVWSDSPGGSQLAANVIAFNSGNGVRLPSGLLFISGNSIFANGLIGIDLNADGVTPNDAGDADIGANGLQNFPVLAVQATGVTGTLNSRPNATFTIQFFGNLACDPTGNGEGQSFLGSTTVATDANGNASISLFATNPGEIVTAVAIDSNNNTSEFSSCVTVPGAPPSFVVTNTNDSGSGSLRQAILDANSHAGGDVISFAIPGTGVKTINLLSPLPTITESVHIDGTTQAGYSTTPLIELNGAAAGAGANGLAISGADTTISALAINRFGTGGQAPDAGGVGILVQGAGTHSIQANFIGTDPSGTIARANRGEGIVVNSSPNNMIGGGSLVANVISANGRGGMVLTGSGTTNTIVASNFIGTNVDGSAALGNAGPGLVISGGASSNQIGGVIGGNVISGNSGSGVVVIGASGNGISQNFIGTNAEGQSLGNSGNGIFLTEGAHDNPIGGNGAPQGNRIAFNQQNGVRIDSGVNNAILANRIFDNGQLGIDLGPVGVTPNDAGDPDTGANNLQNFPVLSAAPNGVQGTLASTPNTIFRVDFYANTACDASGNGEGATFLQSMNVGTDASGVGTIPAVTVASGTFVTATATSPTLSTSEFSACFQSAATNVRTWISDTSGFWEDATNWSEGIVPRNGDSVTINNTGNSFIVQVQSAVVALNTLHSDQAIAMTGGSIAVAGASDFAAGLLLSGGSVGGSGDITLGSGSSWTGGTFAGPGNLTVSSRSGLSLSRPGQTLTLGRSLTAFGTVSSNQTSLSLTDGAQIVIGPDGAVGLQGAVTVTNNSGTATTLTNEGLFEHFEPAGDVTLDGVSFVTSGTLAFVFSSTNDRIVSNAPGTLSGGTLFIQLSGTFTPTAGVPFEVLRFSSRTGTFASITGNTQTYLPTYTATTVSLTAQATSSADLAVTQTDSPDPVVQGGNVTYSITITNGGPDTAPNVSFFDDIDSTTTLVSMTASQGTCDTATANCSIGTLAANTSATVTVVVTANEAGTIANSVFVTSSTSDPNTSNNFATATTTVNGQAQTFVVTNTNDSGTGSLRQAMLDANARTGTRDTITFAIPGAGVHTITPASFLPTITDPVVIDGSTQPGAANSPLVEIAGTSAGPSSNGFFITAANTTIRGLAINRFGTGGTPGASGGTGIVVQGPGGAVIEGNFIGMDTAGTLFRPNRSDGVFIDNSPNNRIGGTSGPSGNVISGNGRNGITLSGASTTGTVIVGNNIGVDINLNGGSFQQTGIVVSGASGNLIGSTTGVGNFIAFNTGNGIDVLSGTSNALLRNRIFSNGALGINLGPAGPTANDPNDVDVGANNLQNFPQLAFLQGTASGPIVRVTLNSALNTAYRVEFFSNPACNASGFGEGSGFVFTTSIATDAAGAASVDVQLPLSAAGRIVTATATDPANNTSEFSACITVPHSIDILLDTINLESFDVVPVTLALTRLASTGGQTINLSSSDVAAFTVPATATVAATQMTVDVNVTAGSPSVSASATLTASASGFNGDSALVVVTPRTMTIDVSPLVGLNRSVDGTIQLARPAPAGGVTIALASGTPSIFTVTPANVTIAAANSTGTFTINGLANGNAQLTASAAGFSTVSTTIGVTGSSLISLGQNVTVAPGNTAGLSLSLGIPAPPGGVTVSLVSSNANVATVTPSVFIPAGLQVPSANPVVTGVAIGSVQIGATATGFAPDSTAATVTLTISFSATTLSVVRDATANITLQLSAPAPAGGLTFNLSTNSTSIATVPATISIGQGLTSGVVTVTGVAVGSTTLRASAPGIAEKTATVNVVAPPAISLADTTVGMNLEQSMGASLAAAAPAGGVTVTITSANPASVLLSTSATAAGAGSINLLVPAGTFNVPSFYVQALAGAGGVTLTASAPGYATDTSTVTLRPSGFTINSPGSINTNTLAGNTTVQVTPERLNSTTLAPEGVQPLRGGSSVQVAVTSGTPATGVITVSPITINGGSSSATTQFDPLATGTSTISVDTPAGYSTPSTSRQILATVTAPTISVSNFTIGKDLQVSGSGSLSGAVPAGGRTFTITSDSPNVLLAHSTTEVGTSSITLPVNAGSFSLPTFVVQALAGTGTAQLTVSGQDYATDTSTVTMVPSGFIIDSPGSISTNSFANNINIQISSAQLNPANLNWAGNQQVRAGASASITVTSSSPSVGSITISPVTIQGGSTSANTAFDPAQAGQTTVSIGTPAGFSTPANFQQITANVTAPDVILTSSVAVGKDLQTLISVSLESAPPSPVTVTVHAASATIATLSTNATLAGTDTLVFSNITGTTVGNFYVQGRAIGPTTLTADAPGYTSDTSNVTVDPSGFIIDSPGSINTNTFAPNIGVTIASARLNSATLAWAGNQSVRGGLSVNVSIAIDDETVGVMTASSLSFGPGVATAPTAFDALSSGTAHISVGTPAGFSTPSNFQQITATVTAPDISIGSATVGRDLQTPLGISLTATPPSPITVTVRSNSTAITTISQNSALEGDQTITFSNVTTTNVGTIYVQGRAIGSTTLTVQAAGYDDGTSSVTVDPSGFIIDSPSAINTNVFGGNVNILVASARLSPTTLNWAGNQAIRGGLSMTVPVTIDNPSVGSITVSPVTIANGVSSAGTQFNPANVGSATISLGATPGFSTSSNFRQIPVTVGTPALHISNVRVGRDLQVQATVSLDATPPSPVTVTVTSNGVGVATITTTATLEGGQTVTFSNVTTTTAGTIYVQGRSIGSTTLTAQATGYLDATSTVDVDPSGFIIDSPGSITTTANAANTNVFVAPSRLDPTTLNWAGNQALRGGLSVSVPIATGNSSVGVMTSASVTVNPGSASAQTQFDPVGAGTTTITVGVPPGFDTPGNFKQIPVTVNP